MVAKQLKQDENGITVLITQSEYESYIQELEEWLEKNQERVIEYPIRNCVTRFVLCDEYAKE